MRDAGRPAGEMARAVVALDDVGGGDEADARLQRLDELAQAIGQPFVVVVQAGDDLVSCLREREVACRLCAARCVEVERANARVGAGHLQPFARAVARSIVDDDDLEMRPALPCEYGS